MKTKYLLPLLTALTLNGTVAGTEMLLAFRGVIDARADEMRPPEDDDHGPTRLEKIDIG